VRPIAGKPAPTGYSANQELRGSCRSRLAGDGLRSSPDNADWQALAFGLAFFRLQFCVGLTARQDVEEKEFFGRLASFQTAL
jgi:hypothetical protein